MNPHTFKELLTIYFSIGIVTSIIGQLVNFYLFHIGKTQKVTLNFTWVLNSVIVYGFWHWL